MAARLHVGIAFYYIYHYYYYYYELNYDSCSADSLSLSCVQKKNQKTTKKRSRTFFVFGFLNFFLSSFFPKARLAMLRYHIPAARLCAHMRVVLSLHRRGIIYVYGGIITSSTHDRFIGLRVGKKKPNKPP